MTTSPTPRRVKETLKAEIRGQYRELVMRSDLSGFEKMLDQYPHVTPQVRAELVAEFKQYSAYVLRRKWNLSR